MHQIVTLKFIDDNLWAYDNFLMGYVFLLKMVVDYSGHQEDN